MLPGPLAAATKMVRDAASRAGALMMPLPWPSHAPFAVGPAFFIHSCAPVVSSKA